MLWRVGAATPVREPDHVSSRGSYLLYSRGRYAVMHAGTYFLISFFPHDTRSRVANRLCARQFVETWSSSRILPSASEGDK